MRKCGKVIKEIVIVDYIFINVERNKIISANISIVDLTEELSQTSIKEEVWANNIITLSKNNIKRAIGEIANIMLYDASILLEMKRSRILTIIAKTENGIEIGHIKELNRINLHVFEQDTIFGIDNKKMNPWQSMKMMKEANKEVKKNDFTLYITPKTDMVQRYANPETPGARKWKTQAILTPNKEIYEIEIINLIKEFIKCGYNKETVERNFQYIQMDTEEYRLKKAQTEERRKEWEE
ncbi:hypothetical protein RFI_26414 [Reticulomyxa filosa]|uniref:Uncharacterized protein n=1 Tax=Reticulomyxa filosa TaxID=46433 RepID=X6MBD1_RETFI|nr:hypothetical protein RFI_26414 [Reticulomyxa filosa]|eukprot:ETO10961.1 hypothetical protein RFI_26414 [Reticulomyxa filosa]